MGVGAGLYMYVVIVQKFTFAISSPDEFLLSAAIQLLLGTTTVLTTSTAHTCTYTVVRYFARSPSWHLYWTKTKSRLSALQKWHKKYIDISYRFCDHRHPFCPSMSFVKFQKFALP